MYRVNPADSIKEEEKKFKHHLYKFTNTCYETILRNTDRERKQNENRQRTQIERNKQIEETDGERKQNENRQRENNGNKQIENADRVCLCLRPELQQ